MSPWPGGRHRAPTPNALAAGDTLDLTIWDSDTSSLLTGGQQPSARIDRMIIAPDGTIHLPYVGKVAVGGLQPDEAREALQQALSAAMPSAQVQLATSPGRRHAVALVSGVNRPGTYPLPDRGFSVLDLLGEGGGPQTDLENPQVLLMRGGRTHAIPASRLTADPSLDIALQGGDRVSLEADRRQFLSLGAAGRQSAIPFPDNQVSALDAVTLIGGLSPGRADPRGVLILREYDRSQLRRDGRGPDRDRVIYVVDLTTSDGLFSARNLEIIDNDLVLVTESPVSDARTIFGLIGQTFGLANQLVPN